MTSALSLAGQGFHVHLIEKDKALGGMARRIYTTLDGLDVQDYLKDMVKSVYQHPLVHVSHEATITNVAGYVGNFTTTVQTQGRIKVIKHGAAILATGAAEYKPTEYLYGRDDRVLTQIELEACIHDGDDRLAAAETLVMIQCVGCRNEERNYCSRICCTHAIKNALQLKEVNPALNIYILFRDMRTYGFNENQYREASDKGVLFIRYEPENNPQVEAAESEDGRAVVRVTVPDAILGRQLELDADVLTLSAAIIPAEETQELCKQFKVAVSPEGFFQEAHVKLRPVDFAAEGVFLCGTAHYPKHILESISQAYGAAGRAAVLLSQDTVTASGSVCAVDEDKCISCGACITACSYGAIEFSETSQGKKARVISVLCKGDGLCNAKCPTDAIQLKHYTDEEILNQLDAAFPELLAATQQLTPGSN
jgi:heterodisulfide reductase subunit A